MFLSAFYFVNEALFEFPFFPFQGAFQELYGLGCLRNVVSQSNFLQKESKVLRKGQVESLLGSRHFG